MKSTTLTAAPVLASVLALATPAAAATDVNFDCAGATPLGEQQFTLPQAVDASGPPNVAGGAALDVRIAPGPTTVPGNVQGHTISQIHGLELKIPAPSHARLVSADLAGGSGTGPTPPTVTIANNIATVHVPGPINGGSTSQLPTVVLHLSAERSGPIVTRLYGTSHDDPGLTFTVVTPSVFGDISVPARCFPNPNPALSTTTIG